jgi:hypothetical protein
VHPAITHVGAVEHVLGSGGQVDLVVDGEAVLVAGEGEQCVDQRLRLVDGEPNVVAHAAQLGRGAVGFGEDDVDGRAHDGQRSAQLVAGVGDEPLLAVERCLEPDEHVVERLGQFA